MVSNCNSAAQPCLGVGEDVAFARHWDRAAGVDTVRGTVTHQQPQGLLDVLTWSGDVLRGIDGKSLQRVVLDESWTLAATVQDSKSAVLFNAGDIVEVWGLTSEAGRTLNGQKATVAKHHVDLDRVEVRLADSTRVKLKLENLAQVSVGPNDCVEVFGLTSESGQHLNGKRGVVTRFVEETGRFVVQLSPDNLVSLRCENLNRICGSGLSIERERFVALLKELRDAYRGSLDLQRCLRDKAEGPVWYTSFTSLLRELQAPIFQRYNYSGGKRGVDRLREDTRKAVIAGDAEVAELSREMAYVLQVCPKGEGTDDGGGLTIEARQQVATRARLLSWRKVGQLMATKGMVALREELLAEGRVVTHQDVETVKDVDAMVRERLAAAFSRRLFHGILGELLVKHPSLLGADPVEWRHHAAGPACSACSVVGVLLRRGWVAIDGALAPEVAAAAGRELQSLHHSGHLRKSRSLVNQGAQISHLRFACEEERAHLRLCLPRLFQASAFLCSLPHALLEHDTTGLLAGLRVDPTTKVLANEPGVRHKLHLDWKGGDQNLRMLTCILYLNAEDYSEADGGALRVYSELADEEGSSFSQTATEQPHEGSPHEDLTPLAGRLVVFLSRRVWHEALPAARDRYGITLWVPALPQASTPGAATVLADAQANEG